MGKKSSKSSSKPWKPARPFLLGAANTIQNTVNANQPHLDEMAGDLRGFLPGLGEKAFGGNAGLDAATGYAGDVLGGKFLNANPFLDAQIDATADDVSDRVNSLFGRSGASLGTQHAGVMTKELANAENSMRFGNYSQERQSQQQAAGMMPSLNAAQYSGVMPYVAATQGAAGLPFAGLGPLAGIGGLFGGYGTQTQPGGWGQGLLGAASMALPFIPGFGASDIRLKKNIRWIRREADGLDIHEFEYADGRGLPAGRFIGPMAQDVARIRPEALGPLAGGYMTIRADLIREAA